MNKLYTIGYSQFTLNSFISILRKYSIDVIVDVRSSPYSKYKPDFNKKSLNSFLKNNGIKYVFLGKECGARYNDSTVYKNGKADYNLISQHKNFLEGIHRITKGLQNYKIALMCAEKDPIICHRMILICRNLKKFEVEIIHILEEDYIEPHKESEKRLLKLFNLDQQELFRSDQEQLEQAYDQQADKIAYREDLYKENCNNGV